MLLKKLIGSLLCTVVALPAVCLAVPVYTQALDETEITAPSGVLMEAYSGKILFEKNSHDIRACASITKVMTLLLVMEAVDSGKISLSDTVTASAHAASMGGSDIWLEEGEQMTVDDMIKATVVASANDAAVALAELISGTEGEFVLQMNAKAAELGMNDTVFKNCNGLDEEGHVTSAYDVALMSSELIKHEKIFEYTSIWIDYLRGGKTQIVNTNKLLKTYDGITGLKTGTTSQAGSCITATAERNGLSLIAVVLGGESGALRFKDAAALLDYGFANYEVAALELPENLLEPLPVKRGMLPNVELRCTVTDSILVAKGDRDKITAEFTRDEAAQAPVAENTRVGKLIYKIDGSRIAEFDILTGASVEEMTFSSVMKLLIRKTLQM